MTDFALDPARGALGRSIPAGGNGNRIRHAVFWLSICVSSFVSLPVGGADDLDGCAANGGTSLWIAPRDPEPGDALRVMAVSTTGPVEALSVFDDEGHSVALESTARGGPPWSLSATTAPLGRGDYRVEARQGGATACRSVTIGSGGHRGGARNGWDLAMEAFYAAWIERLFDAPLDENLNFPSLQPVLRDADRNFLHDYLGLGEDRGLPATPDCADLPYFLRAYFAWKTGLPIAYRACNRGSSRTPPRCEAATVRNDFSGRIAPAGSFRALARQLMDTVHSGSARTALNDEATDFYPVELNRETLWPGTVYADPYGHVLVLVKWAPQSGGRPGQLLAVDAQPDNSVSRKRFWEGTFLFANPIASAGPGFKAYRPLLAARGGGFRPAANHELLDAADAPPISMEQKGLSQEAFYARMDALINPRGLDPRGAYEAMLDALVEQLETRVVSLDNAEGYFRKNPRATIPMPEGAAIFETIGPWEDYSTPSRDLRLLIAMNVLTALPERVRRHPELYVLGDRRPEDVAEDLEAHHAARAGERRIAYTRSDGSRQELSVAEILARRAALEMAYNPNDCVEARWGARPGTAEYATCTRHAPAAQRSRMAQYRSWFREARRPPR